MKHDVMPYTSQHIAEDDRFRLQQQDLRRTVGHRAVKHGSYDMREGGLAGNPNGYDEVSSVVENGIAQAHRNRQNPKAWLKAGQAGRQARKRSKQRFEQKYVNRAGLMLEVAADPAVPPDVRQMVVALNPSLWGPHQRSAEKELDFDHSFALVKEYKKAVERQRLGVMERLPAWSDQALATLRRLGADETALQAAAQRLARSQFHFVAPIEYHAVRHSAQPDILRYYAGDFEIESQVARLLLDKEKPGQYEGTAKHELFHVMSTHAPKTTQQPDGAQLKETRVGLSFRTNDRSNRDLKVRYKWLNELVTEALTRESTDQPRNSYAMEIILSHYIEKQVGMGVLLDAYLEPINLEAEASQQTPYLKKMVKAFHDGFGPGSLRLMDLYISGNGGLSLGTAALLDNYGHIMRDCPGGLAALIRHDNPQYKNASSIAVKEEFSS